VPWFGLDSVLGSLVSLASKQFLPENSSWGV
jgi:hypothetical protein